MLVNLLTLGTLGTFNFSHSINTLRYAVDGQ